MQFAGGVAVITGGGNGIGLALARAMATEGCKLMLADIDEPALARAAQLLADAGAVVDTAVTDVADLASVQALAAATLARFGRVDVVVNNAGVIAWNPVEALTIADWQWVIGVNLWGVIHGVQTFLPILREQGTRGHIVNLSSVGGILADTPYMSTYSATKGAVIGLSLTLHNELRVQQSPIGVSIVCPSATRGTGADLAERNHPGGTVPRRAPGVDALTQRVRESVEGGQPVELLAARVIEGIRANQLWVFPNPDAAPAVRPRLAQLDEVLAQAATQTRDF